MWKTRRFKYENAARQWMNNNTHRYQCVLLFGNNQFLVEYRPLRKVY